MNLSSVFFAAIPLLLIEGFFSGAEIALLSADKIKLKAKAKKGSSSAALALSLAEHPERVFSSTLLMTSLSVITLSSLITLYFLSTQNPHAELMSVIVTSPIILILGELVPKTVFQAYADKLASIVARPVLWIYYLFFPITKILSTYTTRLSKVIGPIEELLTGKKHSTRDDLRSLLNYSKKETEITLAEKKMIKRIFDFKDTEAKHALIPLVKVDAIEEDATIQSALQKFKTHRHSRMPVYADRIDNIIGVLEFYDLFTAQDLNATIHAHIAPAHYVSETQALDDLLKEMHQGSREMVVVVDEYGGAVGILTLEDIVEEVVGEIQDEYESVEKAYKQLTPYSWLIQARMEIAHINDILKLEVPEGDYETLGGFLLQQFGRIPESRDELYFDTPRGSLRFKIRKASERAIDSVVIEILNRQTPDSN